MSFRDLSAILVSGDQLIGHVIQVIADDLWLRTNAQDIVADALDQRRLPAGRYRTKRVPGMASDKTELRRRNAKLLLDISVGFG